ncbi:S1/P1 nuclease [Marivirga arenosa]|uniref:S1/P1 nuclease n=1 Tax=Marivirga arenosa TaxID=3059076 RepID=A0AA49GH49_9BACT|nr:S1/P1 nuclease [Marivirga sp. ABR2-2]WKK86800.1 S1/P1 nuclease [Marivirga sp. ABR2-2]
MKIRIISVFILSIFSISQALAWGQTGHRVVGEVASFYLKKKVSKRVNDILNRQSMAVASVWMDNIKSEDKYDFMKPWHYVTIPNGLTYEETEKNPDGDAIMKIKEIVKNLKAGNLSAQEEQNQLKILIHLVGDIHQPLHVGTGEDIGGNAVKLKWFGKNSNLHRVWDSEMIDSKAFSYTELAEAVNITTKEEVEALQSATIDDWYKEAMGMRDQVYTLPEDMYLGYEYMYKNWDGVQEQLMKAGIRLAGLLNEIYG